MAEKFDFPVQECICGCLEFKILVTFDDYEIATFSLEMFCYSCGNKYVTPTPLDRPVELDL